MILDLPPTLQAGGAINPPERPVMTEEALMKINFGKLLAAAVKVAVPVIVGLVTAKVQEIGTKAVDKVNRPRD